MAATPTPSSAGEVLRVFLHLGLTSFGGPIAHLGYFHRELVARRRWFSEEEFAGMVALSQALPGPASSQAGMLAGLSRAGYRGMLAAWLGFTAPSALLMIALALGLARYGSFLPRGLLHGLEVAAVAVVSQALWSMARSLCRGPARIALAAASAALLWAAPSPWTQAAVLAAGCLAGLFFPGFATPAAAPGEPAGSPVGRRAGAVLLSAYFGLLAALPALAAAAGGLWMSMASAFYRAGALVFGGGHVVLPLLQTTLLPQGWVDGETFLAGYASAQALPGPLFTLAGFLGAAMAGWPGGLLALTFIFLPSFLLTAGSLPFWDGLRKLAGFRAALAGVNAAVVGLLAAALVDPVGRHGLQAPWDWALAGLALAALMAAKLPPWLVVPGTALVAWGLSAVK